ncbi:hypothetical protein LZ30DRAFT_786189 [Colletotrichum cereale]|nr:hypothetical protein LZ30DRAFT_786189 [Colletotrichum cereale]
MPPLLSGLATLNPRADPQRKPVFDMYTAARDDPVMDVARADYESDAGIAYRSGISMAAPGVRYLAIRGSPNLLVNNSSGLLRS